MKFIATYEVSEAMQDASIRDYYLHVMLLPRAWRHAVLLGIMILMVVLVTSAYRSRVYIFVVTALVIHVSIWIRAYFQMRKQAREGLDLMEHPKVEIALDDDGISYTSSTGTRRHLWNKVRRIVESRDFMFLMSQSVPLLSLPKSAFSGEALAFVRQKSWIERKD